MNKKYITYGFILSGIMNIGGVLLFSQFFTNESLNRADPVVMSNFGLLSIILWGLAYFSVARNFESVPWTTLVFGVEKLVYVVIWLAWMKVNSSNMANLYGENIFTGIFYTIYGVNDLIFMVFFIYVFWKTIRR